MYAIQFYPVPDKKIYFSAPLRGKRFSGKYYSKKFATFAVSYYIIEKSLIGALYVYCRYLYRY